MLSDHLKYESAMLEMTTPQHIAAFAVFSCDDASATSLRQSLPLPDLLCDLTPKANLADAFPARPMPVSSVTSLPCPVCAHETGIVPCAVCKGRRKLVSPHPHYRSAT